MSFVNVLEGIPNPDTVVDWTSTFQTAINNAVANGDAGVLVPARAKPYAFTDSSGTNMSIDLRGKRNFVLMGEGPRSVLAMTGPGSWRLIHIGDGATDVVVRDLCLDGSNAEKVDPDDDQLHLVVIGASHPDNPPPHGARRISVIDCILRQSLSDGVAGSRPQPRTTSTHRGIPTRLDPRRDAGKCTRVVLVAAMAGDPARLIPSPSDWVWRARTYQATLTTTSLQSMARHAAKCSQPMRLDRWSPAAPIQ
jgi:hypothetical protein